VSVDTAGGPSRQLDARPPRIRPLARIVLLAASALSGLSRRVGMGSGSVIGGQLAVFVHRRLLTQLTTGRNVALVSGTNGKTTTNHFLARALATRGPVATNADGANMDAGMVVALGAQPTAANAALECDELWMPEVLKQVGAAVVVLLNLSRDQLDRTQEVRSIADSWRSMLAALPTRAVVANADDPLVVWAASAVAGDADERDGTVATSGTGRSGNIVWVGTGSWWTLDATGCPACGGRITFSSDVSPTASGAAAGWQCSSCTFARPEPSLWLDGDSLCTSDGATIAVPLALPGRANLANAAMATAAAGLFGVDPVTAVAAMVGVGDVAGRYRTETVDGQPVRLLLAKNPAGWQEALEMVGDSAAPAVVSINARIADGRDPSWLWDVPFERLQGRFVVAAGERRHDLAVRLAYAEVDHACATSLRDAVAQVRAHQGTDDGPTIDVIGNYTAVQDYRIEVDR
jgi:lipid II isoglutaminyl synthase (glutamine-hydrolysing)